MVMAIFMNHIVDQIEVVPVEAINKGESWPVAITETDDAFCLERNHTGGQEREHFMPFRPDLLYGRPSPPDSHDLFS